MIFVAPEDRDEFNKLVDQIRNGTSTEALAGIEKLREKGWLFNAYLYGADLRGAKLHKVNLHKAVLPEVNFSGADLSNADLREADLDGANLYGANLTNVHLFKADLSDTNLSTANLFNARLNEANLVGADLSNANLDKAVLSRAFLSWANLTETSLCQANLSESSLISSNLTNADLRGADLTSASLIRSQLQQANLNEAFIYGISAWDVKVDETTQQNNLIITPEGEPIVTVDNLKVAQFIYMLLNNEELRDVLDTLASKAVLILGRFTDDRKTILNQLRDELRARDYLPILFDFDKPASRDLTETIRTLAHLSRFIIADISDPRSIPQELMTIVPTLPSVFVQTIIQKNKRVYAMYEHLERYPWVLPIYRYVDASSLIGEVNDKIIAPLEEKYLEAKSV